MNKHDHDMADIQHLTDIFNLFDLHIGHIRKSFSLLIKVGEQQARHSRIISKLNDRILKLEEGKRE